MKIFADYHTHTTFSHGKGTVLENAKEAARLGLKEIAIADHGFGHLLYGVKRKQFADLKKACQEATEKTGVRVLVGVEANFVSINGDIDLTPEEIKQFDVLLVGQHRFVKSTFRDKFKFFLPNMLGVKTKRLRDINTKAVCLAMEKYPIDILTHLKHGMALDVLEVARVAVKTNTLIELNASKMLFTREEMAEMIKIGAKFVVDSDAHRPEKLGKVDSVLEVLKEWGVPSECVVNIGALPKFKQKEK